jgi:ATP-dependent DNA helicase HFM1/MER3
MADWSIFVASSKCSTRDLKFIKLTSASAGKLQDGISAILVADMTATDQYIICHVMCDDISESGRLLRLDVANIA